jgi:hypothetical protein
LQEPNLGKTNSCVTLFSCLWFVFHPLSLSDSFIFLTLTRLVVVLKFINFRFALFTPPLGDFQIAIKANKQANKGKGAKRIWVPRRLFHPWKAPGRFGSREGSEESEGHAGNLETWQIYDIYHGIHHNGSSLLPSGLVYILDPNSPPMTKVTRFIAFLVLDMCIYFLASTFTFHA